MNVIKTALLLFIALEPLKSCLVLPCATNHYFTSIDSIGKDNPGVIIFSTPKYKKYVVENIAMNTEVFIKSPIFENPDEFHLMENQEFFQNEAKQYTFNIRDRRFYNNDLYKIITLKIINGEKENIINYKIAAK
ncbi:MAG: hypothetical protein ABUT20_08570 [Bacteroidota bacterium]